MVAVRDYCTAAALDGELYVASGSPFGVERYTPSTNTWAVVPSPMMVKSAMLNHTGRSSLTLIDLPADFPADLERLSES